MDKELLSKEISFRTARSGGKGGQNVNKVETKAEALLELDASQALSAEEKALAREKLAGHISAEGILSAVNQTERSQLMNKQLAEEKLIRMLEKAFQQRRVRKPTRVPRAVIVRRLDNKKRHSEKKASRRDGFSNWNNQE